MSADDPLEAMARASAEDAESSLQQRISRERRTQTVARVARRTLRWSMFGLFVLAVLLMFFTQSKTLVLIGAVSLLLSLVCAVVLFFLGGLAPQKVRRRLSDRQRRLLDN